MESEQSDFDPGEGPSRVSNVLRQEVVSVSNVTVVETDAYQLENAELLGTFNIDPETGNLVPVEPDTADSSQPSNVSTELGMSIDTSRDQESGGLSEATTVLLTEASDSDDSDNEQSENLNRRRNKSRV